MIVNLFTQRDNTQPAMPVLFPRQCRFLWLAYFITVIERKNTNNYGDVALTMELLAPYERWNVDLVKFTLIPGALYFENSSE